MVVLLDQIETNVAWHSKDIDVGPAASYASSSSVIDTLVETIAEPVRSADKVIILLTALRKAHLVNTNACGLDNVTVAEEH